MDTEKGSASNLRAKTIATFDVVLDQMMVSRTYEETRIWEVRARIVVSCARGAEILCSDTDNAEEGESVDEKTQIAEYRAEIQRRYDNFQRQLEIKQRELAEEEAAAGASPAKRRRRPADVPGLSG